MLDNHLAELVGVCPTYRATYDSGLHFRDINNGRMSGLVSKSYPASKDAIVIVFIVAQTFRV
jgi:hypothetical protein